jgi:hypothetical protein
MARHNRHCAFTILSNVLLDRMRYPRTASSLGKATFFSVVKCEDEICVSHAAKRAMRPRLALELPPDAQQRREKRDALWSRAKRSSSNAEGDRLGSGLVVFETLCQDSKGKDLRFGHGVIGRVAVRKNARQLWHFRKPPAVVFAFALDLKVHGNAHFTPLLSRCLTTE